jgi:hypothetical protein
MMPAQVSFVPPDLAHRVGAQDLGADVDGEEAVGGQCGAVGKPGPHCGGLQFGADAVFVGGGEPRLGAADGVAHEPDQRFVADFMTGTILVAGVFVPEPS